MDGSLIVDGGGREGRDLREQLERLQLLSVPLEIENSIMYLATMSLFSAGVSRSVQTSKMIDTMTVIRKTRRKMVGIENIFMVSQVMSVGDIALMANLVRQAQVLVELNFLSLTFVKNINKEL